jgi:hypothetical protein
LGFGKTNKQTLELLLASRSVWGTVESQVLLRRCTLVGVHLLLLWSLSPLGGQASLRALEKAPKTARNTTTVRYLHTGADAAIFARDTLVGDRHNQIYISALTATRGMKLASMDTWGNVRVPRLDGLNASSASDPSGWQDVPPVTQPEQYSSLLGIPVVGLPADRAAAADFTLVTSYMALSCAPWQTFAITSNAWKPYLGRVWQPPASNLSSSARNATGRQWRPFHSNKFAGASSYSYFFDTDQPLQSYARNNRSAGDPPRRVNFGTVIAGSPRIGVTSCAVTRIDAEVAVRCSASAGAGAGAGPDCRAVHMRAASQSSAASPSPSSPALSDDNDDDDDARSTSASSRRISTNTTTPLDYGAVTTQLFQEISAVEQGKFDDPSLTERVLNDTSSLYMAQNYQMNLTSIPPSVFSPRLSLVLNTYYLSMLPRFSGAFLGEGAQGNAFLSGRDFGNASQSATAFDPSFVQIACPVFCYRSAEARVARAHEAYRVNAAWLALLLASAGVLFGVGCAGAALGWRGTHVPDMLGYVASMTYNNPYVPLPDHDGGQGSSDDSRGESGRGEGRGDSSGEAGEGSGERGGSSGGVLDAMDRARLLRDMRVTIGDVHGAGEGVGHVAFARSGPDVRRLEKGRLYT